MKWKKERGEGRWREEDKLKVFCSVYLISCVEVKICIFNIRLCYLEWILGFFRLVL